MIEYKVNVSPDGTKHWYLNGKLHREDGPAVEYLDVTNRNVATIQWYLNGKRHREDGPAIEYSNGTKQWYLNDKLHREDDPAVEYSDGTKYWYINGNFHREDGPATVHADGTKQWFLRGKRMSEDEFNNRNKSWVQKAVNWAHNTRASKEIIKGLKDNGVKLTDQDKQLIIEILK